MTSSQPAHWAFPLTGLVLTLIMIGMSSANEAGHWGPWGQPGPCSVSCGPGIMTRRREYIPDEPRSKPIIGSASYYCHDQPCPVDGSWSGWGAWIECTKVCGGGTRSRQRECINRMYGGEDCSGEKATSEDCNREPCPVLPRNFNMSQCSPRGNFTCASKKMCVPKPNRCDFKVECHDGSDELNCTWTGRPGIGHVRYDLGSAATSTFQLASATFLVCWLTTFLAMATAEVTGR